MTKLVLLSRLAKSFTNRLKRLGFYAYFAKCDSFSLIRALHLAFPSWLLSGSHMISDLTLIKRRKGILHKCTYNNVELP